MAKNPWDPVPGESHKSYSAFIMYRDMGPGRSLEGLVKIFDEQFGCQSHVKGFKQWARRFKWDERCLEWESKIVSRKASAEIQLQDRSAAFLQKERDRRMVANLQMADLVRAKAIELASYPSQRVVEESTRVSEDGKTHYHVTVIEPSKWMTRDIAILAGAAINLEKVDLLNPQKAEMFDASEEKMEEAANRLAEFRARNAQLMQEIDLNPPGTAHNPIQVEAKEAS